MKMIDPAAAMDGAQKLPVVTHSIMVDEQAGAMAFLLPHSLIGDAAATASKQGAISGQYADSRLTMKGQDAGRRSMNIAEMLGLGRAPHFQIESFEGEKADFLKYDNDNAPRPDTALLMHFSADLASGAPVLEEVATLLKSGDEVAFRYVSRIAALTQALADPNTPQAKVEAILQSLADIAKDRPDLIKDHKALTKFMRSLAVQAAEQFPSAKIEALAAGLSKALSPADLLDQSVQDVIETLKMMAADDSLDEAIREEAEKLIESLENLPEGEPVPLELFEQLEGLKQSVEGTAYAAQLGQVVKAMRGANIIVKAQKYGLTTAEIHKMEVLASGLSQADAALQGRKNGKTLSQQLRRAMKALDSNPLSVAAFAGMSVLAPVISSPAVQAAIPQTVNTPVLIESIESVAAIQQPIITQSPLGSPQAEMLKTNLGVPETVETLIRQAEDMPKVDMEIKAEIVPTQPEFPVEEALPPKSDSVIAAALAVPAAIPVKIAETATLALATAAAVQAQISSSVTTVAQAVQNVAAKAAASAQAAISSKNDGTPSFVSSDAGKPTIYAGDPPGMDELPANDFSGLMAGEGNTGSKQAMDSMANHERVHDFKAAFNNAATMTGKAQVIKLAVTQKFQDIMATVKGCGACVSGVCAGCKIDFNKAMMDIKGSLAEKTQKLANHVVKMTPKG